MRNNKGLRITYCILNIIISYFAIFTGSWTLLFLGYSLLYMIPIACVVTYLIFVNCVAQYHMYVIDKEWDLKKKNEINKEKLITKDKSTIYEPNKPL